MTPAPQPGDHVIMRSRPKTGRGKIISIRFDSWLVQLDLGGKVRDIPSAWLRVRDNG